MLTAMNPLYIVFGSCSQALLQLHGEQAQVSNLNHFYLHWLRKQNQVKTGFFKIMAAEATSTTVVSFVY